MKLFDYSVLRLFFYIVVFYVMYSICIWVDINVYVCVYIERDIYSYMGNVKWYLNYRNGIKWYIVLL